PRGRRNPGERAGEPPGAVVSASQHRERRRENRGGEQDRQGDDQQAANADRSRRGERRGPERREPDDHSETGRYYGRAGGLDRADRGVHRREPTIQLLAKPRDDEQRVIDPDAEPHHGRDVQHEYRHRRIAGRDGDETERDGDGQDAHDHRQRGRDERPEGDDQHQERERQRPLLAPLRVFGADRAHVVIQGGEPRDHHYEVLGTRHPRQRVADRAAEVGDVAAAQVAGRLRGEGRDEERGAAVLAHEARFAD